MMEMNKKTYIRAVLECNFAGFKDDIIESAIKRIMEYAEPIKRGRWIWRGGNLYECSECGAIVIAQDYIPIELHYFCRGCGAKMWKVEECQNM